jgi:hypothetical protein
MEDNLDPSLAVKTPLVQDDSLRRDDFASRGSSHREGRESIRDRPLWLIFLRAIH